MTCLNCRYSNAEEDHRCRRCGRRLDSRPARPAPDTYPIAETVGALAAAIGPSVRSRVEVAVAVEIGAPAGRIIPPRQQSFVWEGDVDKVIAFPTRGGPAPHRSTEHRPRAPRRQAPDPNLQPYLDFLPPAPHAPRTLATSVEAAIYCDAAVATPVHRAVAGALDAALILIAYGLFLITFAVCGGSLDLTVETLPYYGLALIFTAATYGLAWILAGADSAGRRWTGLHTINFDGLPAGRRQRVIRFLASIVSFGSAGLGVAWAMADEESLTWHDHISKTFPTVKE
jgi:uncharacterized RDD family membrane protein YckC